MGKLRNTVLVLGEGPTEFYYFHSLRDVYKGMTIKPDYPKHTTIKDLEAKIAEGVEMGFSRIFCVIDMDTKEREPEKSLYARLKKKYERPFNQPKKGLRCEVKFFETHRCTELFFLYYFKYTSRDYCDQDALLKDLNQSVEYRKTADFFVKCKGLHSFFERRGGSLASAIMNAEHSVEEKMDSRRNYTYSELGRLMMELERIDRE